MKICLSSPTFRVAKILYNRIKDKEKKMDMLHSYVLSSHEGKRILEEMPDFIGIKCLDSGVFSVNNSMGPDQDVITIDGYIDYCKRNFHLYDFYFGFDLNFDPLGAHENYRLLKQMQSHGLNPVPVIHDIYGDEIECYLGEGHTMLAIGSILPAGASKSARIKYDLKVAVNKIYKINPDCKIHVFASSSLIELHDLRIYSSDSSSWAKYIQFGMILYWNEHKKGLDKTDFIYFYDKNIPPDPKRIYYDDYEYLPELEQFLWEHLKFTRHELMGEDAITNRMAVNAYFYMQLGDILTGHHRRKGFPTFD